MIPAVLVVGATGIIGQVVLMRELLTSFLGNELSLGVILACWLFFEALGSWLAGRVKPRFGLFVACALISSLALPFAIYFCRVTRPILGLTPGEVAGPLVMLAISAITLLPTSLLHGASFTLGTGLYPSPANQPTRAIGRVYVAETTGSIIGGIALSLLLIGRAGSLVIVLAVLAVNAAVLAITAFRFSSRTAIAANLFLLIATGVGLGINLPGSLDKASLRRQYPGNEIAWYGNSSYGSITVLHRAEQYTLLSDGMPTVTLPAPDYTFVEDIVHLSMLARPDPRQILVIGSGIGGVLAELLKYPQAKIDYCELDPALIDAARRVAPALVKPELDNPRVSVKITDGRRYLLAQPEERFDLILIYLRNPATLQLNRYFSQEFASLARSRLTEKGILIMPAPGSLAYFGDELSWLNRLQLNTLQTVFPAVRAIPGDFNLFLASRSDLSLAPETLALRLKRYGFKTRLFSPDYLAYRLSSPAEQQYLDRLDNCESSIVNRNLVDSDLRPVSVLASLAYETSVTGRFVANWFSRMAAAGRFAFPALAVLLVLVLALWLRRARFALGFAIFSTGFAGAGLSLVILLLVQISSGAMFYFLSLLTTVFMLGAALGSAGSTGFFGLNRVSRSRLYVPEILVCVVTGAVLVLATKTALISSTWTLVCCLALAFFAGVALGAEFPLAGAVWSGLARSSSAQTAGTLYAADLFGGFVSALLVPIFLVPALGIPQTLLIIFIIKVVSLLMLSLSR